MADLTQLSPAALKAAMAGGVQGWGLHGSALAHVRYAEPVDPKSRRKCLCGCKRRATHRGMANGVCLMSGCQLYVWRWVKKGVAA